MQSRESHGMTNSNKTHDSIKGNFL